MQGRTRDDAQAERVQTVAEHRQVPTSSFLLGYAAMAPLAVAAILVWIAPEKFATTIQTLAITWGALLLAFFSGVRRGGSFRTEGGPARSQLLIMLWLFALAFAALSTLCTVLRAALVLAGFATLLIADRPAARAGQQPLHFTRLRPPQMTLAVTALAILTLQAAIGT